MILEIEVVFTDGQFHGKEWPPSPSRLFQALVASTHQGAHGLIHQEVRDCALRWLESLPPPTIVATDAVWDCDHLVSFVPNNDDQLGKDAHVRTDKSMGVWNFPCNSVAAFRWPFPDEAGK